MPHSRGTFEVKMAPHGVPGATVGRMTLDKIFRGDLEAGSKGEMLSAITAVKGSAGYVALEVVTGMLDGLSGSFVLQHSGTMKRGEAQLSVTVVPDSGTEQLTGLAGRMEITNAGGKHSYEFEYSISQG
jgi:hypothetical protein